jgi:homoserine kinase
MAKPKTIFSPATIGNVGPGFDVLGLAIEGLGDTINAEPTDGPFEIIEVTGRDAELIPKDPEKNAASIAARALLQQVNDPRGLRIWLNKGLPISGGLGGSAASSVAGALAAAEVYGHKVSLRTLLDAALAGESAVSGRHLDNIAPCILGGFTLVLTQEPPEVIALPIHSDWWIAVCTPNVKIETRAARAVLPLQWERSGWVQQMANTAALVHAFAIGDEDLVRRSLDDVYAEPRRAPLIPNFFAVKQAALSNGAFGCSISGAGATVFALCPNPAEAERCLTAMQKAFDTVASVGHIGRIARKGANSTLAHR